MRQQQLSCVMIWLQPNVKVNSKEPEYTNSLGVVALLKGDYNQAEKYLKAAADSGLETAKDNLNELAKKKANIAEIKEKMR